MKKILENELVKISVDSGRGTLDLLGKDGSLAVRGAGAGVQIGGTGGAGIVIVREYR